jgi:class 3 adenylate cyclase/tetratricopeptide (TPR) repeat protein
LDSATKPRFASPDSYTPKYLAERIINSKTALEGERKQVTVLFADLKGSMELLADRDPEEAREILDPVLEHMMEAVHRYEGTVNQVMGDGIMALFGAPLAHEDHAIRACYAALRMQESIKRWAEDVQHSCGVPVKIRVGLNSGDVLVRAIGSDLRMDYTAVGQTTHLAARMEQLADAGTAFLAPATLTLAEGFIEVKSLGPKLIKGLADPIQVYQLTGATAARSRLQAAAGRQLTRFVGRASEVSQLHQAFDLARAGKGQVVGIVGEPGVGKSRLSWEVRHLGRSDGWLIVDAAAASYGRGTAFLLISDLLKSYFLIEPQDDAGNIQKKVSEKVLSLDEALASSLPPLFALLDIQFGSDSWRRLDLAQRRQHILEAVKRLLLRESRVQPVVVLLEDLHWIDSETQALLDTLVDSIPTARLLLLVSFRPEYKHQWGGKTYYKQLRVDPLPTAICGELLASLLGDDQSLQSVKQVLIERSEGNPLFLEESVRSLVETSVVTGDRGAYRLALSPETLRIPPTVQAMLAARIDRLADDEKQLLQAASVLGREFSVSLLATVLEGDDSQLQRGLARLLGAEFLYEAQLFPRVEYVFRHALTQEVAYTSLPASRRQDLHASVVGAMTQLHGDRVVEHAATLAFHARRAELWEQTVHFGRLAGLRASLRSGAAEAIRHYQDALEALGRLPMDRRTTEEAVDLLVHYLRSAQFQAARFGDVLITLRRAEEVARGLGDPVRLGYVAVWLLNALFVMGQHDEVRQILPAAAAALDSSDQTLQCLAALQLAQVSVRTGDVVGVRETLESRLSIADQDFVTTFSAGGRAEHDQGLPARLRGILIAVLGMLGEFDEAVRIGGEATRIADSIGHPFAEGYVSAWITWLYLCRGNFIEAIARSEQSLNLVRTKNVVTIIPSAMMARGWALCATGRSDDGLRLLEEALRIGQSQRLLFWHTLSLASFAEACLLVGNQIRAGRVASEALDLARERREPGMEAWLYCVIADTRIGSDSDIADREYRRAVEIADALRLRPLVARSHLGLGRLSRIGGRRESAVDHLTFASTMYRDMGMTYWLEKAEAEMRELR